jgi:hypothetical protein
VESAHAINGPCTACLEIGQENIKCSMCALQPFGRIACLLLLFIHFNLRLCVRPIAPWFKEVWRSGAGSALLLQANWGAEVGGLHGPGGGAWQWGGRCCEQWWGWRLRRGLAQLKSESIWADVSPLYLCCSFFNQHVTYCACLCLYGMKRWGSSPP